MPRMARAMRIDRMNRKWPVSREADIKDAKASTTKSTRDRDTIKESNIFQPLSTPHQNSRHPRTNILRIISTTKINTINALTVPNHDGTSSRSSAAETSTSTPSRTTFNKIKNVIARENHGENMISLTHERQFLFRNWAWAACVVRLSCFAWRF